MLAEPTTTGIYYYNKSSSEKYNHLRKPKSPNPNHKVGIRTARKTNTTAAQKRRQIASFSSAPASVNRLNYIVVIVSWCMLLFLAVPSPRLTKTTATALSTRCGALLPSSSRTRTTSTHHHRRPSAYTAHLVHRQHPTSSAISLSSSPPIQSRALNDNCTMSTPNSSGSQKAKYIPATLPSLHSASSRLLSGHLVSFPTETVYGLGAHALDEAAIQKIFDAKERPTSDPLIVHLNSFQEAAPLWSATASSARSDTDGDGGELERSILASLTAHFWPGPLTIVALASPRVPSLLMAGTGYVACRSPRHPVARALIAGPSGGGIPIAAPSANKFGHVSPTRPRHVMDDLGEEDVWIVDPALGALDDRAGGCCDVGVESTVVKVEMVEEDGGVSPTIILLRHGAVSEADIAVCLRKTPYQNATLADHVGLLAKPRTTASNVSHVAPGQILKHYSPNVLSYIVSQRRCSNIQNSHHTSTNNNNNNNNEWNEDERRQLRTAVVIDFGGRLRSAQPLALAYRDLDEGGDSNVAAANVFDMLRWSETVEGAERVYFPEIEDNYSDCKDPANALVLAVKDRLTRAASGVVVDTLI